MSVADSGVFVGLALADSTSVGTLAIPIWLLLRGSLQARRIVLYLAAIAGFYGLVSLLLLAVMTPVVAWSESIRLDRSWTWGQLAFGVTVLALGMWIDRRGGQRPEQTSRSRRWRNRALQLEGNRGVVGLALAAGVLEVATMLPLLTAVAMVERSDLTPFESALATSGYVAIMVLPACVLLSVRLGIGERGSRAFAAAGRWLERHTDALAATVLVAVGGLVSADAAVRLDLVS